MNTIPLDLYRLCAQQRDGSWGVGVMAEYELRLMRDLHVTVRPRDTTLRLFGMPVLVDPTLPPGRVEFRDQDGKVVGAIENIGAPDA